MKVMQRAALQGGVCGHGVPNLAAECVLSMRTILSGDSGGAELQTSCMSLIDKLEKKFGRFAIPGLVNILAGLQVAVWILMKMQPGVLKTLFLVPPAVWEGEVWRLVTWVVVPSSGSTLWLFFQVMFMFMMGDALDEAWGAFRTNLYLVGGIVMMAAGVMLLGDADVLVSGMFLYTTLLFAFAVFYPDYEILVMLVLPLKAKYLALILGGNLVLDFFKTPQARIPIVLALLNFAIAFGGHFFRAFRQGSQVADRRRRFESAQEPDAPTLHRCHSCGKSEKDDSQLDFRVAADGHDYCSKCRKDGLVPSA
jgi:membrane associated rhomboid family serine protease